MGWQAIVNGTILGLACSYTAGCTDVFGNYSQPNPDDCVNNPALCMASEQCNQVTHLCEPVDAGAQGGLDAPIYAFRQVSSNTAADLFAAWGSDANNIWVVGRSGTILKWNGQGFIAQTSNATDDLQDVWGADANNVWAVGYMTASVRKWNGSAWTPVSSGATGTLVGVYGYDASHVWIAGQNNMTPNTLRMWNGTTWTPQATNPTTTNDLHSMWGPAGSSNNIWIIGNAGTIAKWNGMSWSLQTSPLGTNLYGIWGADLNNVWAVGDSGTIGKWNGTVWMAEQSGSAANNYGIWGSDFNNVWVVGASGTIL